MGKIVKYCESCEEGFAEKFTFCPDCGGQLQAFEMKPVTDGGEPEIVAVSQPQTADAAEEVPAAVVEEFRVEDDSPAEVSYEEEIVAEYDDLDLHETKNEISYFDRPAAASSHVGNVFTARAKTDVDDDGYHVTVIEEKNVGQRNGLLLGATVFMILFVMSATVYSLFSKDLGLSAIGDDDAMIAYLGVTEPMAVEEEKEQKKKDDAGGGGGGGKNEKDPVNQGDLANQTKNPVRPPDVNTYRSDNFELKTPTPSTEGNKKFEQIYGVYGDPNSRFGKLSNGPGSGGGIGTGAGTGQGSGSGTGTGSGSGSGYGDGDGDGNGNGRGSGTAGGPPPPPTGVTSPLVITYKARANYTDPARQNNVQGVVRLRVTFNANGTIGSISPVSTLPYGLTEQAIAAARQMKFEPKKVNGVPVSSTKVVEFSFAIY
ncbi:MAG: energy transducer TonB [Pyrinomonadaceae bacterium]